MDLEASALQREQVEIMLRALAVLTTDQLEVIVMRYYVGLPVRQVAIVAGVNERAVHARQARALHRLREALAARGITEGADIL